MLVLSALLGLTGCYSHTPNCGNSTKVVDSSRHVVVAHRIPCVAPRLFCLASFIAFFVAEIGDKTQIATSILGAQYADALSWVIFGTTIGMLLANVPVVLIGKLSADKMPLGLIRKVTAFLFIALAIGAAFF